jgi:hypothetical protein
LDRKESLLQRLQAIAQSVESTGLGLAVLGLGSVGLELDRLDPYSDLDFFVIVRAGAKTRFLQNLDWLQRVAAVSFCYQNTPDGHKLLFDDGVFCEFAVFEADELPHIPFAEGRIVWIAAGFDPAILKPKRHARGETQHTLEWTLGEILTSLYVGLVRHRRGEKLSAMQLIQGYAVDRLLELAPRMEPESAAQRDPFDPKRRFEARFTELGQMLPRFLQGYERNPESARAILNFAGQHFELNPHMKKAILELC